jgi:hypothetical protein
MRYIGMEIERGCMRQFDRRYTLLWLVGSIVSSSTILSQLENKVAGGWGKDGRAESDGQKQ